MAQLSSSRQSVPLGFASVKDMAPVRGCTVWMWSVVCRTACGRGYLLYVSSKGTSDGIWKLADGAATELWSAAEARIIGGPETAPEGHRVAFSVEQRGRTLL